MGRYTIYVDESGDFDAKAMGHRIVVALALPLAFDDAESAARFCLDAALEQGWPRPFHATECVDPEVRVGERNRLDAIRALARSRIQRDDRGALQRVGRERLRSVRHAIGELLRVHQGFVVLCGEHDQDPAPARPGGSWPRMVTAAVERASVEIALQGGAEIDLRIAIKDSGYAVDPTPRKGCVLASHRQDYARALHGLQLADTLAHGLATRTQRLSPMADPELPLGDRRRLLRNSFAAEPSSVRGSGALATTHGRVLAAIDPAADRPALVEALSGRPLPHGTVRYAADGSAEVIRAL